MKDMKVIGAPIGTPTRTSSLKKPYAYACYQPGTDPNIGIVFKLRFTQAYSGPHPSLVVESEHVNYVLPLPSSGTYDDIIVNSLLSSGEKMGSLTQGIPSVLINQAINKIATETLRGPGNQLIVHPDDEAALFAMLHPAQSHLMIHVIDVPALKGKLIVGYKGPSDIDGSPIFAANDSSTKYAIASQSDAINYNKVFNF